MKLKTICRKLYDYVRYDLKEIAFPSSLPDPPNTKKLRKLTWKDYYYVWKEGNRLYFASWVRDIGPELRRLRPDDDKKNMDEESKPSADHVASDRTEPSTLEELAVAARGGMETLRPVLQRIYMIRASSYRDALRCFIQGYQEGIKQVMEENAEINSKGKTGGSEKPTSSS